MSKTTPATTALTKAGVDFKVHTYTYEAGAPSIGMAAATAIGVAPERVFKTLMMNVDGKPACAVLPVDHELSMKKAAAALKGKSAQMMKSDEAEKVTGYHVGGISPFGQRKRVSVVVHETAQQFDTIVLNGGQRGVMIELAPADAIAISGATIASITS